jgi:hypothetical protein
VAEDLPLAAARAALERGDYGQVVRLLAHSANPGEPEALLLLATARMGQGQGSEALACCRLLRRCGDATIRAQARELQRVLEAPALKRPREWSLTLPELGGSEPALGRQLGQLSRRKRPRPPEPPPPAVGRTRAPLGFGLLVLALVLVALLLGGCGQVRSELHFGAAGRLQLRHHLLAEGPVLAPWQQRWSQELRQRGFSAERQGRELVLSGPVRPTAQTLAELSRDLQLAADLAALPLPAPELQVHSRNWLVGVAEELDLRLDLRGLPSWPGLEPGLLLQPLPLAAVRQAGPAAVQPLDSRAAGQDGALLWPLRLGADNQLQLVLWRWSPLGLGALVTVVLLGLSLLLQTMRRQLGFGLPELPR